MINESPEKEFTRYSIKPINNKVHSSRDSQLLGTKQFVWITATILFIFTLTLGIIVGISITPKSAVYSQKIVFYRNIANSYAGSSFNS